MPSKKFKLPPKDEVMVSWKMRWKQIQVHFNGVLVGEVPGFKALRKGVTFTLSGGSRLQIQWVRDFLFHGGVNARLDEKLCEGSVSHPKTSWNQALAVILFIAAMNVLVGLVAEAFKLDYLLARELGLQNIFYGLFFALLGYHVYRKRRWAMITSIIVYVLDSAYGAYHFRSDMGAFHVTGLLVRILFFYWMVRGLMVDEEELTA